MCVSEQNEIILLHLGDQPELVKTELDTVKMSVCCKYFYILQCDTAAVLQVGVVGGIAVAADEKKCTSVGVLQIKQITGAVSEMKNRIRCRFGFQNSFQPFFA